MEKTKITIIYGGHGAGKTTLLKNIINEQGESETIKTDFGKITYNKTLGFYTIGDHTKTAKTGGDSVTPKNTFILCEKLIKDGIKNIFIESVINGTCFSTPLKTYLHYKYNLECKIYLILLWADKDIELNRVFARNGHKTINKTLFLNKQKTIYKNFKKIYEIKEFKMKTINTTNLSSLDVLKSVKDFINA